MSARTYDPPADPVDEDAECLHCSGTAVVDDDAYEPGFGLYAVQYPCDRCEGTGHAPVDAAGRCACDDCLHLPYAERLLTEAVLVATEHPTTEESTP